MDLDLWLEIGAVISAEKDRNLAYKRQEPNGPIITDYGKHGDFVRKFFDLYVDQKVQPYTSKRCSWTKCEKTPYRNQPAFPMALHYMTHFCSLKHEKFRCPRCRKNYASFRSLQDHGGNGMCKFDSDYPKAEEFIQACLDEHPEQKRNSKTCSKCRKWYDSQQGAALHFMSCIKQPFACLRCGREFVAYLNARVHYEACTSDKRDDHKANFTDKIAPPTDADDKEWTQDTMMDRIREISIPQLRVLFDKFPQGAYGTIGMTSDPLDRFCHYRKFPQFYRRHETTPYIEKEELILYKCWTRKQARMYEYLLQRHFILDDGEFYEEFGQRMNQQAVLKPSEELSEKKVAHYVYFQASRTPFTFSLKFRETALPTPISKQFIFKKFS